MAVNQVYRNFLSQLQVLYGPGEASVITDRVFEKIASIKRSDIIRDPERQLNDSTSKLLNDALADLLEHKPVQYVLGEAWFYQLNLKVNDQVLIPRPETEELVKLLIDNSLSFKTDPVVLDMGTGSGCIAIALKKNLPATKITGLDISSSALDLARENASFHQTNIEFILMDFLDETTWPSLPVFDILISNPPYITMKEKKEMAKHVLDHEPHLALFVPDEDPLVFYEKIAAFGLLHLQPNGQVYLETNENLAKEVKDIFAKDYRAVEIKKDLFGKERMVIAYH